jgi:GH15 family glucan-1,4-alpha-glucosidase
MLERHTGFSTPNRPRREGGLVSDSPVSRYDPSQTPDGPEGIEGTSNMCTFWLVEAPTRVGERDPARLDEARLVFEQMMGYANHPGLFAEQIGGAEKLWGTTRMRKPIWC